MLDLISSQREAIAELCRRHHVRRLSVFGSAARGDDFNPETSDVDLMVEFDPLPFPQSMDNRLELEEALVRLFKRPVDLIREDLVRNPYLLREIRADKEAVYVA